MERKCPRCETEMNIAKDEGVVLDWCVQCNGLWFDFSELDEYLSDTKRPENFVRTSEIITGDLPCPACGEQMDEVRCNELTLDRCSRCRGIWFDAGEVKELKRIIEGNENDGKNGLCSSMVSFIVREGSEEIAEYAIVAGVEIGAEVAAEAVIETSSEAAGDVLLSILGGFLEI